MLVFGLPINVPLTGLVIKLNVSSIVFMYLYWHFFFRAYLHWHIWVLHFELFMHEAMNLLQSRSTFYCWLRLGLATGIPCYWLRLSNKAYLDGLYFPQSFWTFLYWSSDPRELQKLLGYLWRVQISPIELKSPHFFKEERWAVTL